jgi:acyl-CoA synthetase (AMP-forming)/AMP-acid ligase II
MLASALPTDRADAIAIVSDEGSLRYGELLARSNVLAERLGRIGVGPGTVVLVWFDNVPAFLVALLAIAKVGGAYAPLEAGLTDTEVDRTLALVRSDLVIGAPELLARRRTSNAIALDPLGALLEAEGARAPAASVDPNVGCLQFSSGTTGTAKGILLDHDAFFHRSVDLARALGLGPSDRTMCALPLSHTHGAECLALPTLVSGGTLHLMLPKFAFPLYVLEELAKRRITFYSSIPQFYDFAVKLERAEPLDLSALRLPFCGSAALARTTAEAFFTKYGVHIRQGYGLAELSVICMNRHDDPHGGDVVYDSVGTPLEGIDWRIEDGELVVRSRSMFSGYIDDPLTTAQKLRDGWLYTGDVVEVGTDGRFRIVGRKEDFVKVNGFKVYAAEVEAAIIALPWVAECAVVAERDAQGAERLVAHVVLGADAPEPFEPAVASHLRERLSEYKLPRRWVREDALPKNPLGKVLKSKIGAATP